MDLLKLAAKIELDDSSYNKGINNAEKAAQQLQGKMSAMTVAMGNIAADLIRKGVSAVQSIVGGAVDAYADYEQLVGGVDTLFGQSSKKVQQYAKESFKTTGLSANAYMETVTSFSASLLQGLDGDTELAADLANTAITDMADNANKMGTDISSIQNAYQGFAKQNYTMLDNLKLGYGGTASEMVRLVNDSGILKEEIEDLDGITFDQLVEAIHVIQTEMGITGTTAAEAAATISGSKASLEAAWQDMLSAAGGQGDADFYRTLDNFKSAFATYMENFIPSLVLSIRSSGKLVTAIGEAIKDLPEELLGQLTSAGLEAGTDAIGGVTEVVQWIIESLATMFRNFSTDSSQIEAFAHAIGEFVSTTVVTIAKNIPTFIQGLADVGMAIAKGLVDGIIEGLTGDSSEVDKITDALNESMTQIDADSIRASGLIEYLDGLIDKYGEAAAETEEWKAAQAELEEVMPGAGEVFEDYGQDIGGAVDKLKSLNEEMRKNAILSALEKASQSEMELLAGQTLEYNKQKVAYDTNKSVREGAMGDLIGAIQEAARAEIADLQGKEELRPFEQERLDAFTNLINGFDLSGLSKLEDLDLKSLWSVLENLGIDEVNGKGLEAYQQAVTEAQIAMDNASAKMADVSAEIEATKTAITQTNAAMDQTVMDLFGGAQGIGRGGEQVYSALSALASDINSIDINVGGGNGDTPMPEATGMDYVPYDGFTASLHRGERIVTAAENKKMSNGSLDVSALEDRITAAIRAGMENATVRSYLNGRDVTDEVNRQNMKDLKARRYST